MKTALELHKDADYYISVQKMKDCNGCDVIIPENIMIDTPKIYCRYVLGNNKLEAFISDSSIKVTDKCINVVAPNYALRTVIIADLLAKAYEIGIDTGLVCYYNEKGDDVSEESKGIYGLMDKPFKTEEDSNKEIFLFNSLLELFGGQCEITEKEIEEKGVMAGYNCILQLLRDGVYNDY